MTLTDIKRPQAIAVVCKYLVYQASSGGVGVAGHLVSDDTLTHSRAIGCVTRMLDAGPGKKGGGGISVPGSE